MKVSILIVNYNTTNLVLECIRSIRMLCNVVDYEIIVADNGSDDGVEDKLKEETGVRLLLLGQNLGFAYANNRAAEVAKGDYLFCLNPDTLLRNDAITFLVDFMDCHLQAGACCGNLFDYQGAPIHSYHQLVPGILRETDYAMGRMFSCLRYGKNAEHNHTGKAIRVNCITGADMLVRRSAWELVGGFSEQFFMYYEDADLCKKLCDAGWELWSVPEAEIVHLEGQSFNYSNAREERILSGRQVYYKLHYGRFYTHLANIIARFACVCAVVVYTLKGNGLCADKYRYRIKLYSIG